jgi:hypothetical protein
MSNRTRSKWDARTLDRVARSQVIGIRAGSGRHRIIGIWAVVVGGRIFVRSWSMKPDGWNAVFRKDPNGIMTVGSRRSRICARPVRSEATQKKVSAAYAEKYHTPGSVRYVKDFAQKKRRQTTMELTPGG